jgi:hypothetical protein
MAFTNSGANHSSDALGAEKKRIKAASVAVGTLSAPDALTAACPDVLGALAEGVPHATRPTAIKTHDMIVFSIDDAIAQHRVEGLAARGEGYALLSTKGDATRC